MARLAGFLARGRGDKVVWSLDKTNVLAISRLWRKAMTETFLGASFRTCSSSINSLTTLS